jgi:hypothetical protein
MNFEEVLNALKDGKDVRRTCWNHIRYINLDKREGLEMYVDERFFSYSPSYEDLFAYDWEIVE